jgi:hypothetical protein
MSFGSCSGGAEKGESFTYWDYASSKRIETRAQSRSVMLLNALDRTRKTLTQTTSFLHLQPGPKGSGNLRD